MYLYVTYELSPHTKGGVGTYMNHVVREAVRTKTKIGLLFGINQDIVAQIRGEFITREHDDIVKVFSVYDFVKEHAGDNVYWCKSLMFCEAITRITNFEKISYIEFFDYCGAAYHTLCEKATNPALRDIPIAIRNHNTIEVIDRFSGRMQEHELSPYNIEREAIAIADSVIIPSMMFWKESANIYNVPPSRLVEITPPFTKSLLPRIYDRREGIVFLGRPSMIKGFDTLAVALELYQNQRDAPRLPNVTIIGPDETVTGGINMDDLAERTGLGDRLHITGYVHPAEVREIIGRFDIAVFPNRTESYCYALHEARLAGVRIIANAIPAFLAELQESSDLRFFDGTPSDLARVLRAMLDIDQNTKKSELARLRASYVDKPFHTLIPKLSEHPFLENCCLLIMRSENCVKQHEWDFARVAQEAAPNIPYAFTERNSELNNTFGNGILDLLCNNINCKTIFIATVCRDGATPDHVARALRRLTHNPTLQNVMIFSDCAEQDILAAGEKFVFSASFKMPTVVIWQFSNRAQAYNHIAKKFDLVTDANTIRRCTNSSMIGSGDHPSARKYYPFQSLGKRITGIQSHSESLDEVDHRLRIASSLRSGQSYLMIVRGSIRCGDAPLVFQLFGFEKEDINSYTSSYGVLLINDEAGQIQIEITSNEAELWIYRAGKRKSSLLKQGIAVYHETDSQEHVFNPLSLCLDDSCGHVSISESNVEQVFVLDLNNYINCPIIFSPSVTILSSIEEIIKRISLLQAKHAHIILQDIDLNEGLIDNLIANSKHLGCLELSIMINEGFFYSQNWTMHLALEYAKRMAATSDSFTLTLQTKSTMAPALEVLGFNTRVDDAHQKINKRLEIIDKRKIKTINILMSSAGTYAGHYGHQLCALALALNRYSSIMWLLDIVSPNTESQKLLLDLKLSINTNQINSKKAKDKAHDYDLVIEVFPDGIISEAAGDTIKSGARGLLARGSEYKVATNAGLSYIDEWEAADRIADELVEIFREYTLDKFN